ncbi:hypothetical protein OH492_29135 [Vibrio chagasii]|nr:hypothetical protein [Vibrio chagasii]
MSPVTQTPAIFVFVDLCNQQPRTADSVFLISKSIALPRWTSLFRKTFRKGEIHHHARPIHSGTG